MLNRFYRWVRGQQLGSSLVESPTADDTGTAQQTRTEASIRAPATTFLYQGRVVQAAPAQSLAFAEERATAAVKTTMLCSITHELMADPVMCEDGQTYERSAIEF